jgi:E3 ubiquitin-protein ligase UBR3
VFFTTIVRQVYNLCWLQACLRLACRLPVHIRAQLRDSWLQQTAIPNHHVKIDTLSAGLGVVVATLEPSGMFNDDVDCPRTPGPDSIPSDVTVEQLEAWLQAACLPYLRIAALLRHYVYSEPLPDIWEADWEFTRLAQFLGMADTDMSGRVLSAPCLGWLVAPATLAATWARELGLFASKSYLSARRLALVHCSWQQPQLLRLPHRYDTIFQVAIQG